MNCLDIQGLVKTLRQGVPQGGLAVLRGVTFSMAPGERLGLKGATGAGKTTLLRIIAGLITPDSGEVRLDQTIISSPTTSLSPAKRNIGFVFQNLGLWPHLTVEGHMQFVLSATCLTREEQRRRCDEVLETFAIIDLRNRYPGELSGGERHLLAIGRALCSDIRLLLLDEPFNGLDGLLKKRMMETLQRECERRQLSTLLVTHNDDEMRVLCQRVQHLCEGRILENQLKIRN